MNADPPEWAWKFPSIPRAYEFVRPSYEYMARRFEAVETRNRAILGMALTVTVATPVFAKAVIERPDFLSGWFIASMIAAALVFIGGNLSHFRWKIMCYQPMIMLRETARGGDWQFQYDLVHAAATDFETNEEVVSTLATVGDWMTVLLVVEVILLTVWIITVPSLPVISGA